MLRLLVLTAALAFAAPASAQCLVDRLQPSPGSAALEDFGFALAIEDDFLAVGARGEFGSGSPGRVIVYERTPAGDFEVDAVLFDGTTSFGSGVAFSDGRLAVLTHSHVRFFEQQSGVWTQLPASVTLQYPIGNFVYDRPIVGGSSPSWSPDGIYYLGRWITYREEGAGYAQYTSGSGTLDEMAGSGMGLDGILLAVGSPGYGVFGEFAQGRVRVYEQLPAQPAALHVTLHDPLQQAWSQFGRELVITDRHLVVAAGEDSSRLETYAIDPFFVVTHTGRILPPAGVTFVPQGSGMAMDGDTLLVPASEDGGSHLVLRFEHVGGSWVAAGELPLFGASAPVGETAVDGATAALGSFLMDRAWVWSLDGEDCPGLVAAPWGASLSGGGVQDWMVSFGPSAAGQIHLVLGSASGSAPGVPLGALSVPLVPDAWTTTTLVFANQPPFEGNLGLLDGLGTATAALHVPAGIAPGLAGLTLHHAALAIDLGTGNVTAVSAPTTLQLVP